MKLGYLGKMQPVVPTQLPDPQLGSAVSEWRVGGARPVLLGLLIVVLGGGLIAALVAGLGDEQPVLAVLSSALVLGLVVLLLALVTGPRVVVYTHGIERTGRFGKRRLAWDQLQSYTLNYVDPGSAAIAGGGGGLLVMLLIRALTSKKTKPQSITLLGSDAKRLTLSNHLKGYETLLDSLLPYLTDRLLANVHQAMSRGIVVPFGRQLALDPAAGVVFTGLILRKKESLALSEIESTDVERGVLLIRKRGQQKPWQRIAARGVPNLGVFQKFAAQMSVPQQALPPSEDWSWTR